MSLGAQGMLGGMWGGRLELLIFSWLGGRSDVPSADLRLLLCVCFHLSAVPAITLAQATE